MTAIAATAVSPTSVANKWFNWDRALSSILLLKLENLIEYVNALPTTNTNQNWTKLYKVMLQIFDWRLLIREWDAKLFKSVKGLDWFAPMYIFAMNYYTATTSSLSPVFNDYFNCLFYIFFIFLLANFILCNSSKKKKNELIINLLTENVIRII